MEEAQREVGDLIAQTLQIEPAVVQADSRLINLTKDSIQLFELLTAFEKAYAFRVSYSQVVEFQTVADVVRFVHSQGLRTR